MPCACLAPAYARCAHGYAPAACLECAWDGPVPPPVESDPSFLHDPKPERAGLGPYSPPAQASIPQPFHSRRR